MNEEHENNSTVKPQDYLVAALLDYYRSPKAASNFMHAAKLAQSILARNSVFDANLLEKRFIFFASKLKDNISIVTLKVFAETCFAAARKTGACKEEAKVDNLNPRFLAKHAKEDLSTSLRMGHSEGAAINRAAYELMKKRKESMAQVRMRESIATHPLRETLQGLMMKEVRAPKEDIRNKFLQLKRFSSTKHAGEGMLFTLLAKAQAFSASRMHRLLGDELFFLCRPTGFLDQKSTTVVVEVPTTAHLHALTYKKLEVLRALKTDDTFAMTSKVHVKISRQ